MTEVGGRGRPALWNQGCGRALRCAPARCVRSGAEPFAHAARLSAPMKDGHPPARAKEDALVPACSRRIRIHRPPRPPRSSKPIEVGAGDWEMQRSRCGVAFRSTRRPTSTPRQERDVSTSKRGRASARLVRVRTGTDRRDPRRPRKSDHVLRVGQQAPADLRHAWDPDDMKKIRSAVRRRRQQPSGQVRRIDTISVRNAFTALRGTRQPRHLGARCVTQDSKML